MSVKVDTYYKAVGAKSVIPLVSQSIWIERLLNCLGWGCLALECNRLIGIWYVGLRQLLNDLFLMLFNLLQYKEFQEFSYQKDGDKLYTPFINLKTN